MAKKRKGYFYEEEEKAVIDFNAAQTQEERNVIFKTKLEIPFTRMIESIIRRYNLHIPYEDFNDTFNDTLSFLFTKISNFSGDKNTKAYSYCGTICKHYLMYRSNQNAKLLKKYLYVENVEQSYEEKAGAEDDNRIPNLLKELIDKMIIAIDTLINGNFKYKKITPNEIKVGYALKEMLMNWEDLILDDGSNKLNKSSILYYLREQTLLSTKEVTMALKKYKILYFNIKNEVFKE